MSFASSAMRFHRVLSNLASVFIIASAASAAEPAPLTVAKLDRATPVDFQSEILPLMKANCLACHNKTKAKADLILETPADMIKGGKTGPGVVPGKSSESLILKAAAHELEDSIMPPVGNKVAAVDFTPEQLGLVRLWIDQGAAGQVKEAAVQWRPLPVGVQPIYALTLSPNGRLAAIARGDRIDLLDATTRKPIASLGDPSLAGAAHRDLVNALAFNPDGRLLASGGYREIKLWRKSEPTRQVVATAADGHGAACVQVAADSQRKRLAFAGADGVVTLVDGESFKVLADFPKLPVAAVALQFSPDGARLAAAAGKMIQIWNVANRSVVAQIDATADVRAVAWIDGGKRLASTAGGVVEIWKPLGTVGPLSPPQMLDDSSGAVVALEAPSNPALLLALNESGEAKLWNTEARACIMKVSHGGPCVAAAITPDGKRFATGGKDGVVKLWHAGDGRLIAQTSAGAEARESVTRAEAGASLAAAEATFRAARLEAAQRREQGEADRVKKAAEAVVAAEKRLVVSNAAYVKSIADVGRAEREQPLNKVTVESAAKARDAAAAEREKAKTAAAGAADEITVVSRLAAGVAKEAIDAKAELWAAQLRKSDADTALEAARKAAEESRKAVKSLAFSPDGQSLAAVFQGGEVQIIAAESGGMLNGFTAPDAAALAFAGSDQVVIASPAGGAIWSITDTWTLERTLGGESSSEIADRVNALDFSPDGRLLAAGGGTPSRSGEILLYDAVTGRLERRLDDVHTDAVLALRFSPDGRRIASGSADRLLRVVDLTGAVPVRSFEGHTHHVLGVAWRWDGRVVATAGADDTLKLWDADTSEKRKNITGFDKEVTTATFIGRTNELLAAGGDGRVRRLREDGSEIRAFSASGDFLYSTAFHGATILAGGQAGTLWAWNAEDGKPIK